jgi:hypothetical protein
MTTFSIFFRTPVLAPLPVGVTTNHLSPQAAKLMSLLVPIIALS